MHNGTVTFTLWAYLIFCRDSQLNCAIPIQGRIFIVLLQIVLYMPPKRFLLETRGILIIYEVCTTCASYKIDKALQIVCAMSWDKVLFLDFWERLIFSSQFLRACKHQSTNWILCLFVFLLFTLGRKKWTQFKDVELVSFFLFCSWNQIQEIFSEKFLVGCVCKQSQFWFFVSRLAVSSPIACIITIGSRSLGKCMKLVCHRNVRELCEVKPMYHWK